MIEGNNQSGSGSGCVLRWTLNSAFLGLVIGLFEASLLWTTPRVLAMLVPDVGWVIWFLAPLVDMAFFALVGLGLGLLASRTAQKELLIALAGGITITFAYFVVDWLHKEFALRPQDLRIDLLFPLIILCIATVISLLVLVVVWHPLNSFLERRASPALKLVERILIVAIVVCVAGIGVYVLWPPVSGPAAPTAAPPPRGAPNIVFITLDTVRADHLSSYGYSRPTTPNIDRFAQTGVLFENAIAPTSWTLASHASLFTGLLPQQHGADWIVPISSSPSTLAEILRSQGYQTAGFVANNLYLERGWGIAKGFGHYEDFSRYFRPNLESLLLGNAVLQPLYQTFDRFDNFDRENAQELNTRISRWFHNRPHRPYFLFINYFDAHLPYITSGTYNHRFGSASMELERKLIHSLQPGKGPATLTTEERKSLKAAYDNCLAYLDSQVEQLLMLLRRSPDWQNTIVIITSDHGEEFGAHLSYQHGRNLYREVLHVPLIIAGPGIPKNVRISHLVGTRQLFSTVLDLAGHGHTPFSRASLARFWNPNFKPGPFDDAVVSELVPIYDAEGQRSMMSIATSQWQYIVHRDGRQELYDLKIDPGEKDNLAAAAGDQATLEGLRLRLVKLVSDATGPWHGMPYLQALDTVTGPARLSLLHPLPFQPGAVDNRFRIGSAQAYFEPDESTPTRPSRAARELMQTLPYQ